MEKTFTKEEVLKMVDEAMRLVKGGDDYPDCGTEKYEEYRMYGPGIAFAKGVIESAINYELGYKYDYKKGEWIEG